MSIDQNQLGEGGGLLKRISAATPESKYVVLVWELRIHVSKKLLG